VGINRLETEMRRSARDEVKIREYEKAIAELRSRIIRYQRKITELSELIAAKYTPESAIDPSEAAKFVKGQEILIPDVFARSPEIMAQLSKLEEWGIVFNGERAIVENPKALEKFKIYVEILNFIHDVPRDNLESEIK